MLDFGATRSFSEAFVTDYLHIIDAAIRGDRDRIVHHSLKLGFLSEKDNTIMIDAHIKATMLLARPFASSVPFDFGSQDVTGSIRSIIPIMLANRSSPPPRETYSLHRKLSGTFLLCTMLKARVDCLPMFNEVNRFNCARSDVARLHKLT